MSFFGRVFGGQPPASSNGGNDPPQSSSSSSSHTSPSLTTHKLSHPNHKAQSRYSNSVPSLFHSNLNSIGSSASPRPVSPVHPLAEWESMGIDNIPYSPLNPFRDNPSEPFPSLGAQPCARTYFAMVEYNNKIFIYGGFDNDRNRLGDLRSYDIEKRRWELIQPNGTIPKARYLHSAVVYRDSMVLFGGSTGKDNNELFSFDFPTQTWSLMNSNSVHSIVPSQRFGHAACVNGDNMILTGGCSSSNQYFQDSYLYHFPSNTWKRIADIPINIAYHALVPYQDQVILLGGYNGVKFNDRVYSYTLRPSDPLHRPVEWVPLSLTPKPSSSLSSIGTRQPPPFCGAAVVIATHYIFVFGGYSANGHHADLYQLNLLTREWAVIDTLNNVRPTARAYLQGVITRDGSLVIFGGFGAKCVSDFRRISVLQPEINLIEMLKHANPKEVATFAMKHFTHIPSTPTHQQQTLFVPKATLDEGQLEALLQNLKQHLPPPTASSSSSSSSSSSLLSSVTPSSSAYPFDTSRLSDLMELGFSKELCLQSLQSMVDKKLDTSNFNLVVDHLLKFEPRNTNNAMVTSTSSSSSSSSSSISTSSSSSSSTDLKPPIPPRPSIHLLSPSSQPPSPNPSSSLFSPTPTPTNSSAQLPPSTNTTSLQDQVNRLTSELSEIRTCKVCFEGTIDCVLMPCGHLIVCQSCAEDLRAHGHECPTGRCQVESFIKVYWS